MPERFEIYVVYKRRYINTLPFLSFPTGPPRAAPGELRRGVTDDDRRQAKQYCMASYTVSLCVGRRVIIWFVSRAYWVHSDVLVHRIGS